MTDQDLDAAERNYRNAIEESRKGERELAIELSAHGGLLLVQHLRASQPATETASRERVARALDAFLAPPQPAPQPVEGVSDDYADEHTVRCILQELWYPLSRDAKGLLLRLSAAARSSAAKDATIETLKNEHDALLRAAQADERERLAKDARIAELEADLIRIHAAIGNRAPHDNLAGCIIDWIESAKGNDPEPII
jgi:hypothetical protein